MEEFIRDKNTKFFHHSVKINHFKFLIHKIRISDDKLIEGIDDGC